MHAHFNVFSDMNIITEFNAAHIIEQSSKNMNNEIFYVFGMWQVL